MSFEPCDSMCPALTGEPYNRVRYCPMMEADRHKNWGIWFKTLPYAEQITTSNQHEDYTDCCANFQCCMPEDESPRVEDEGDRNSCIKASEFLPQLAQHLLKEFGENPQSN